MRANCARIHAHVHPGTRLFGVVKAQGYGHGVVGVARAALEGGATGLGVATVEEAAALGDLAGRANVLVMGGVLPTQAAELAAGGWSVAVSSKELVTALADAGAAVPVHLKIDTGMGRFGCTPEEAPALARLIHQTKGVRLAGTWTHFASAESDDAMTHRQFARFKHALTALDVDPGLRHICNSAATLRHPDLALDAVRCGIAMYGCEWPGTVPALALRAAVTQVKTVARGATVGYGSTWKAPGARRVATVAIGYADGVSRARSNNGDVLVRGWRAPLIGVVSMDAITIDVTEVPGVEVGDMATLIGSDGDERITAEEVAAWSNTISYEVLTSIGPRVERHYSLPPSGGGESE